VLWVCMCTILQHSRNIYAVLYAALNVEDIVLCVHYIVFFWCH